MASAVCIFGRDRPVIEPETGRRTERGIGIGRRLEGVTGPFENRPVEERVLLIGIGTGEGDDVESSLAELAQLV